MPRESGSWMNGMILWETEQKRDYSALETGRADDGDMWTLLANL